MPSVIWKFELPEQQWSLGVQMPKGAVIRALAVQHNQPCVWAEVDPRADRGLRLLYVIGTGHPLPPKPHVYVGTFMLLDGAFVGHVYDLGEADA